MMGERRVMQEALGPEAVAHGREKSPSASAGVIPFDDLKKPSWGANIATAEAVTEARRRAVSVPVRRGWKTVDATALYEAADGAALAIRAPTPSVPFPMKPAPSVPALSCPSQHGNRNNAPNSEL